MVDPYRFEILSAYLDGEVSESERALVDDWLINDSEFQAQYLRQIKLKQLWNVPKSSCPDHATPIEETWQFIQTRQQQRWLGWGVGVLVVAVVSIGGMFVSLRPSWQQASEEPIKLALEQPLVPLPKDFSLD